MLDSLDTLIAFVLIISIVSLLVTIVVQMLSSLMNLRGRNVARGLSETFHTIVPALEEKTQVLAKNILTGTMISDNASKFEWVPEFWRLATAVRPAEAFDALHRIAIGQKKSVTPAMRADATTLLLALGVDPAVLGSVSSRLTEAGKVAEGLQGDIKAIVKVIPAAEKWADTFAERFQAFSTQVVTEIEQRSEESVALLDQAYTKFEYWFEIGQERAQQWFSAHARRLTVVFGIVFAFWLQLDTIEIFKLVSTNRAVRDQLVAQAGVVEAQASKIFADSSTVLQAAMAAWSKKQTVPAIGELIAGVKVEPADTREAVQAKVEKALNGQKPEGTFDEIVNETATARLRQQAGDFNLVKADLEKTGFALFPKGRYRWYGAEWDQHRWEHIWGMICTAGLLSLGAPFWFNLLKSLMSLRSTVAENISGEKKENDKKPDADKPGPAPVTIVPAR